LHRVIAAEVAGVNWSSFGMARRPFRLAVDTASYFSAASHESAFAALKAAFARGETAFLIDGPPGAGKSLVARRWLEQLSPEVPRVVLPNAHAARPADLLQAILFDLNQPYEGMTEQELRLAVTAQLLTLAGSGYPVVALVDEAQHLSFSALEELRLLGNIEVAGSSTLFAVLVALPGLRESLARPAYAAVAQHVADRCRVDPLSKDESADYLRHQVRAAGGEPSRVFDDETLAMLAGVCDGIPRILNSAAALALELAAQAGADRVDVEAAMEALQRLGRALPETDELSPPAVLTHPAAAPQPARAKSVSSRTAAGADDNSSRQSKPKTTRKRSA
jgi:type II secretory pathway predicted ATPase ExeA